MDKKVTKRHLRELWRKTRKCARHAERGERRRGGPKDKTLHPNRERAEMARENQAAREAAALEFWIEEIKNGGDGEIPLMAYMVI